MSFVVDVDGPDALSCSSEPADEPDSRAAATAVDAETENFVLAQ